MVFSPEEEKELLRLHAELGNKWTAMARSIGKSDDAGTVRAVRNRVQQLLAALDAADAAAGEPPQLLLPQQQQQQRPRTPGAAVATAPSANVDENDLCSAEAYGFGKPLPSGLRDQPWPQVWRWLAESSDVVLRDERVFGPTVQERLDDASLFLLAHDASPSESDLARIRTIVDAAARMRADHERLTDALLALGT